MALSSLKLEVLLSAIDKATAPLKRIQQASVETTKELKATRNRLAELQQQQAAVESFRKQQQAIKEQVSKLQSLRDGLKEAKAAHASARDAAAAHAERIKQHESVLSSETAQLKTLRQALRDAKAAHAAEGESAGAAADAVRRHRDAVRDQVEKMRALRQAMRDATAARDADSTAAQAHARHVAAGERAVAGAARAYEKQAQSLDAVRQRMRDMGITNVSEAQARLAEETKAATAAMEAQRQKLGQLRDENRRLMAAQERYNQTRSRGADLQGAGASMIGAGVVMAAPVVKSVQDFASFEDAMLGVARQVPGAKDDGAQLTAVYAAVREQVHALGREIPLTTNQIAEMITAGARMEVGKDAKTPEEMVRQLAEFTRNSAAMAIAFDAVPDEIAEQMGKVAKNFGIPVTSIGNLADAINYLDDNAISKGGDIINVLNRISGVISTVKMSANDAAALGSTLLTLGDRPEVAATAINAITQKLAAATKGSKKFQQAVKEIGWSSVDIQRGMQTDATATYMELFKRLEKVAPDKRVGIMVELVGLEHSDTLAKLANGAGEFKRQLELANAEAAKGSMGREMESRQQALSAQFAMARNRAYELTTTLGESLKPGLLALLDVVNPIVERMAAWARENQGTVAVLMGVVATIAVVLAVVGTLTLAVGTLLAPIALANYALALMGVTGGVAAMGIGTLLARITVLGATFAAAYAAGSWFAGMIDQWLTKIFGVETSLGTLIFDVLNGQPEKWRKAGSAMVEGMATGISDAWKMVKDAVGNTADGAIGWFKGKLGIKSPSRVFAEAGAEIPAGAALGIEQSDAVRRAALAMAASALVAVPGMAGAQVMPGALPALPPAVQQVMPLPGALPQVVQPMSLDAPQIVQPKLAPSMSTATGAGAMPGAGPGGAAAPQRAPYEIHIHQQPGESPDALISRLSRMIDDKLSQADRAAAARRRSSFTGD